MSHFPNEPQLPHQPDEPPGERLLVAIILIVFLLAIGAAVYFLG